MAKLTLTVDDTVIARAKEYAKRRGVSVPELVEDYVAAVTAPPATPILNSLRGILKHAREGDYRKLLPPKY